MTPDRQLADRCPERAMYPGELLSLLWRHKHPRFTGVYIDSNRWGARARDAVGLAPHGTLHFTNVTEQFEAGIVVCDCIPYATQRDAEWDEALGRYRSGHKLVRGWRKLIASMAQAGFLYPDPELDYLTGERTWTTVPKEYRL